ncbi:13693_t:CDS:1, partial [Gigaspora rosea]
MESNSQNNTDTDLLNILQHALPKNYEYAITSFKKIPAHKFLGAYDKPFEAEFCINITTIEQVKLWLQDFTDLHKVTMRETQGRSIKGVRYLLSKRFHCIHSHVVKLKQGTQNKNLVSNDVEIEKSEDFVNDTRSRNTNCPAVLS